MRRKFIKIYGIVQGVGFRPFVYRIAQKYDIRGYVRNNSNSVVVEAEGEADYLEKFLNSLLNDAPPASRIDSIEVKDLPPDGFKDFKILRSDSEREKDVVIPPDIAICEDCKRELFDPSDRRYLYPFINCTNCGPRYTIIRTIPYDRPRTTMSEFQMCPECEEEYHNPMDRRFHAQPVACAKCGPHVWMVDRHGEVRKIDFKHVADLLRNGAIIAIKGLGGFHFACDAANDEAVRRLRKIKNRPAKPFALMVPDISVARKIAHIDESEEKFLKSWQAPIVLLKIKEDAPISPLICSGLDTVGIMLPYTPLHLLILNEFGGPLVMTSGNVSDSPIVYRNDEVLTQFKGKVDYFILHNRKIHVRIDDSVARVVRGKTQLIRRARGYVPLYIDTGLKRPGTILGLGGLLKSTFTFLKNGKAYVSQYFGDLDNYDNFIYYRNTLKHFENVFGFKPDRVACDLHPGYPTTDLADEMGLPVVKVQHHLAHIFSVIGEKQLYGKRILGFSFDGTGFGEDGKIWGGEIFLINDSNVRRVGHFSYFPLPTGDSAIKNPWKLTAAFLLNLTGKVEDNPWFEGLNEDLKEKVVQFAGVIKTNEIYTSSVGRLFDAFASLLGIRQKVDFEAQAAMELEAMADDGEEGFYDVKIDERIIIDSMDFFAKVYEDYLKGTTREKISARIHNTFVKIIEKIAGMFRGEFDFVAVSGGVFQNRRLLEGVIDSMVDKVVFNQEVPPNDGGISLGQAVYAALKEV